MAKKIIELKNIVKAYGDNVVVKGMNLYVNDVNIFYIILIT